MSRAPFDANHLDAEPMEPDPGPPGSVLVATLLLALVTTFSWMLLPLLFLPAATVRWLRAIRGVKGPAAQRKRAAFVYLALAYAPIASGLPAVLSWREPALSGAIAALGVALALVPMLLRAPLVLVSDRAEDRQLGLLEGLHRALVHAACAPLETMMLTAAHLGATLLALGLARAASTVLDLGAPIGLVLALALPPLLWTPVMLLASRSTPAAPPTPSVRSLGVLALMLLPALGAIVLLGVLATKDPLPLEVLREGRGIQHERGMMLEGGPRGRLDQPGFTLRSSSWSEPWDGHTLVVDPDDGLPYPIAADYDPADARMRSRPCGPGCVDVTLEGPDWAMRVRLDERGHRLDDSLLDRAQARVGVSGTAALGVGAAAVALSWLLLSRLARRARRLGGAGFRHRLAGRLRLGENGVLEGGATEGAVLVGARNRVELLEGSVVLRLPERITPLGVDPDAAGALDGADVHVSMNEKLDVGTHRSADAPWPPSASLVLGSPAAIESEAIRRASKILTGIALAAVGGAAVSLVVLSFGA